MESALQGAVAGLNVTTTSGQPGAASIIRIRGGNSITGGNEPLYVIDGFIVYNDVSSTKTGARGSDAALDPLSFLNPSDIESIEVLKDVSATAIYGTRGANGVIIITTKKGSHGKNNINYSGTFGWSKIAKKLDFLDAWQWADIWNELYENGEVGYRLDEPKETYDWQDAALRTAFSQEHQLSAVGGDEVMQKVASILGLTVEKKAPQVAVVRCNGSCTARPRTNEYDGVRSCRVKAALYSGDSFIDNEVGGKLRDELGESEGLVKGYRERGRDALAKIVAVQEVRKHGTEGTAKQREHHDGNSDFRDAAEEPLLLKDCQHLL